MLKSTRFTGATSGWALWLDNFEWNKQGKQQTGFTQI